MIREAHRSALDPLASKELLKETVEKVKNGFTNIIRYWNIKDRLPEYLNISPVAMIPHTSRKFRCILDLSFCLKIDGTRMPSVNSSTTQTAPQNSMDELGRVLERLDLLLIFCFRNEISRTVFGEFVYPKRIVEIFVTYCRN